MINHLPPLKVLTLSNDKIIKQTILIFVLSSFFAYSLKIIQNYFLRINPIYPPIEKRVMWNLVIFSIIILQAKQQSKPKYDKAHHKYIVHDLHRTNLVQNATLSSIVQIIVFFTNKGFFLYLMMPIISIVKFFLKIFKGLFANQYAPL